MIQNILVRCPHCRDAMKLHERRLRTATAVANESFRCSGCAAMFTRPVPSAPMNNVRARLADLVHARDTARDCALRVARQVLVVEKLRREGYDTSLAESLLVTLRETKMIHEENLARLKTMMVETNGAL